MFLERSSDINLTAGGVFTSSPVTSYASLLLRPIGSGIGTATIYGSTDNQNFEPISDETTDFDVSKTIEILSPYYLYYQVQVNSGGSGSIAFELSQDGKRNSDDRTDFIQVITESSLSASLALGETSTTAYRGDRGKTAFDHSQLIGANPHNTTASQVGAYSQTETNDLLDSKADLVGGKLASSQVPAIAIVEFLGVVASQSAMLALVGQSGDWCVRSDESSSYVITGSDPSILGSWSKIITPGSPVDSVNGQVGVVTLTASDVGAPSGSGTSTGTNTGDETTSTIKSKLSISTLAGDNTGDETTSSIQTKRPIKTLHSKSFEGSGDVLLFRNNLNPNTQAITANTDTYITGSNIDCPSPVVGTHIKWTIVATKTAAGIAAPVFRLRFGASGSISDAIILTLTGKAQTAVVDTCKIEIECFFTAVGASGIAKAVYKLSHNLSTTGFANVPNNIVQATSGTFNTTTANLKAGVSVNSGASAAWTIQHVQTEIKNI